MTWWLLACSSSSMESFKVSTIRTNVEFTGIPQVELSNGDVFILEDAFAVLYSIRFYQCPSSVMYRNFSPISSVYAGHSDIAIETNWNRPTHIDLLNPTVIETEVFIEPQSICSGAVTWARWDGATLDLPSERPDATYSVVIRGRCQNNLEQQQQFEMLTSVPSEKIQSIFEFEVYDDADTLNFTVAFDTTDLLHKIECNDDLTFNSSPLALQVLYNIQNNATWTWEWE